MRTGGWIACLIALLGTAGCTPLSSGNDAGSELALITEVDGRWRVGILAVESGELELLPHPQEDVQHVSWSPDGDQLAYMTDEALWIMGADGTGARQVVEAEVGSGWEGSPGWSADGKRILYTVLSGTYVVNVDGSGRRRLLDTGFSNARWSPDGRRLTYESARCCPVWEVHLVNVDGSQERRLVRGYSGEAAWSPDGTHVAFTRGAPEAPGFVHVIRSDGTGERRLARGSEPAWSSDGSLIAFTRESPDASPTNPRSSIWMMSADGSGQRRLYPRQGYCACDSPAWRPT